MLVDESVDLHKTNTKEVLVLLGGRELGSTFLDHQVELALREVHFSTLYPHPYCTIPKNKISLEKSISFIDSNTLHQANYQSRDLDWDRMGYILKIVRLNVDQKIFW